MSYSVQKYGHDEHWSSHARLRSHYSLGYNLPLQLLQP